MEFKDLDLKPFILDSLKKVNISKMTEIQQQALPIVLQGQNLIANAMTGQGKSLVYILPVIQKLSNDPMGVFCLIFLPSRELAQHMNDQFLQYGSSIGGQDWVQQSIDIDKIPHIVIATPGCFSETIKNNKFLQKYMRNLNFLIFDEFDKLQEKTLLYFIQKSLKFLPKEIQYIFTTSTFNQNEQSISQLQDDFGVDSKSLKIVNLNKTMDVVTNLNHFYIFIPGLFKDYYFLHTLEKEIQNNKGDLNQQIIVFFKNCKYCYLFHHILTQLKIPNSQIHSFIPQNERLKNLEDFKNNRTQILLTTDLGARGLDLHGVELVIHYNFPKVYEDFVHRSGRAARGRKLGRTISLITQYEIDSFKNVEEKIKQKINQYPIEGENKVIQNMNRLDRAKRKVKIEFLAQGTQEKFKQIKKKKNEFQKFLKKIINQFANNAFLSIQSYSLILK